MTDHQKPEPAPVEERLRAALADRATHIEPSPDGLDRIEEELMSETTPDTNGTGSRKWIIGALSAAAVVVVVVVAVAVVSDDDEDADVAAETTTTTEEEETTTTESTSTTTAPTTTSTEAFPPAVDPFDVAFPAPGTSRRFEAPEQAAQAYATDVLGFTDLELGEYRAGDSRSGELPISDRPGGPETVVLVRQMEDDSWYVLASVTEDITVDEPVAGAAVSTPFTTEGAALAFEGQVGILVLAQDDPEPLGESFVTGSGTPPAGPFEGGVAFEAPDEEIAGVLVYRTLSAEDGHVQQATSFPVRLQPE